jgi:hypothetical protein
MPLSAGLRAGPEKYARQRSRVQTRNGRNINQQQHMIEFRVNPLIHSL